MWRGRHLDSGWSVAIEALSAPHAIHMIRRLSIALTLFGAVAACSRDKPASRTETWVNPYVQAKLGERTREDTRPDSFTTSADLGRVMGDSAAKVWIVMVSDFQCADCKRWYDEVYPLVKQEYVATGRVRFAYINMPSSAHLNATPSALAAACASAAGKFWETAGRIFDTQILWKDLPDARPFLDSLAIAAGVNAPAQRLCTERARSMKLLQADVRRGQAAGVDSLPTFFVGTHKVVGPAPFITLRPVIEAALSGK